MQSHKLIYINMHQQFCKKINQTMVMTPRGHCHDRFPPEETQISKFSTRLETPNLNLLPYPSIMLYTSSTTSKSPCMSLKLKKIKTLFHFSPRTLTHTRLHANTHTHTYTHTYIYIYIHTTLASSLREKEKKITRERYGEMNEMRKKSRGGGGGVYWVIK